MAHNILDASNNDLADHQDQFEIKDEIQEGTSTNIYRVKNYVQTKFHRNFSKSCRLIASCAAICIVTIMTIMIIIERQNSATKTIIIEVPKKDSHKNSSNETDDQILRKSIFEKIEFRNNATYEQNERLYESNKTSLYYFLQEILLSDNNKLWLFNLRNKSLSLFYETESTIDTFDIFTKQEIFFSSYQEESTTIYSFSGYEKVEKSSFDAIFNEGRFRSRGIAFDFISKNIYAVDEDMGTLIVLNLNTKFFALLLTDLTQPRNIYVDPLQGIMFILQVSDSIIKGDMNGENLHIIIRRTQITAMTLDVVNKRIYWVNDIIGIESSDYNGRNIEQFHTNTAIIIDLSIVDDKLFWIWKNHHYPNVHHLLYCKINGKYCENHEMHHLENLNNITTVKSVYGRHQNLSKVTSYPCEVENGGCEQLCFSIPNEKFSCACKLGWQLKPDKKTCYKVSNFILYMSKNVIRGHLLDVAGNISTEIILPTPYEVGYVGNTVKFDYDQVNDNIYFSDGQNIYKIKIHKYQQQITLLYNYNIDNNIIDVIYDWLTGSLYSYEINEQLNGDYCIKKFLLDGSKLILQHTKNFENDQSRIYSGVNIHPTKQLFFYIQSEREIIGHEIYRTQYYSESLPFKLSSITSSLGSLKRPIAIDFQENKLYWIENESQIIIKSTNLDGGDVREIMVDKFITHATYIFVYGQWIYLADEQTVWRIYKKSGKGVLELVSNSGLFSDVRLISNHTA